MTAPLQFREFPIGRTLAGIWHERRKVGTMRRTTYSGNRYESVGVNARGETIVVEEKVGIAAARKAFEREYFK